MSPQEVFAAELRMRLFKMDPAALRELRLTLARHEQTLRFSLTPRHDMHLTDAVEQIASQ